MKKTFDFLPNMIRSCVFYIADEFNIIRISIIRIEIWYNIIDRNEKREGKKKRN